MEIDINQKQISIGDKYKIFVDGVQNYAASSSIINLLAEINLFELNRGGRAKMTINKIFSWFKPNYDITRWDNNVLQFRTVSFWKMHYQCQFGSDCYDIYGHNGRKYSIYKNSNQVAWWDKQAVSWFAGDNYKITADKDCDVDLVICFCLIVDHISSNNHDGNTVTVDLGSFGFQVKKFDKTWLPKN